MISLVGLFKCLGRCDGRTRNCSHETVISVLVLTACKIFPIPNLQPEFYGPDAADKRAYRQLRVRKLGRYVRIFPRNLDPDAPISCIQVEIFGEPYISKCLLMNSLVSSPPPPPNINNNQEATKTHQTHTGGLVTCELFR